MAEERNTKKQHKLILDNRNLLNLTGVTQVDSFDETEVILKTDYGKLVIKGSELKVSNLSVEKGEVAVGGFVTSISYMDSKIVAKGSILAKVFG